MSRGRLFAVDQPEAGRQASVGAGMQHWLSCVGLGFRSSVVERSAFYSGWRQPAASGGLQRVLSKAAQGVPWAF